MPWMQAPSPWPDVIISSQHELAPNSGSLPAAEFRVNLPHFPLEHVTDDPFAHTTSGTSAAAGNGSLATPGVPDMDGEQKSKAGKAAARE